VDNTTQLQSYCSNQKSFVWRRCCCDYDLRKIPIIQTKQKKKCLHTLGTAAWNTNSVMGRASEFVAVIMIDTTLDGLPGTFSNPKFIFKPLFSKAVIDGKPIKRKRR